MFRATTPLQEFELPFNTQDYDIKEVVVTYSQKENELLSKRIVLEKTENDVTFVGNKISYRLTQEETLLFDVGVILIQIRFMDGENNVVASDIFYDRIYDSLNNEILGKPREPITEELTATANGEYYPSENKVGFSKVTVQVADTNGSYDEGYVQGGAITRKLLVNTISPQENFSITKEDLTGATEIKDYAFFQNKYLESIQFPESVTKIGINAFTEATMLKGSIDITNVTSINDYAFKETNIESVVINCNISSYCFWYCQNLTSVTLGNNISKIMSSAFSDCKKLTNLTIPASVTEIGGSSLQIGSPENKATITFLGTTPPKLTTTYTFSTNKLNQIIVPKGSRATYIASTNWANYADYIVESEV